MIHETAIVEDGVQVGDGTSIWDSVHIRSGTKIGRQCIVGEKTYIAYRVRIGDRVKINSHAYLCFGVQLDDGVLVGAGVIFTNDRYPRATRNGDLRALEDSAPTEQTKRTLVREGATIGAGCVVGSDLEIGRFAMVGMGSVVTRDVDDFHLVAGNPAKSLGCVCRCGHPLCKWEDIARAKGGKVSTVCQHCDRSFSILGQTVEESDDEQELDEDDWTPE